ncbi:MAG TPA: outer membrane beta-barrel protein [Gemmatimonadaceae bacterium]|nr:outer membrane beta-barrel protein [Gemmatimonadaceae bacterium]
MRTRHLLACVAALALVSAPARGQLPGIDIGIAVGANVPRGDFNDGVATGLVLNGILGVRLGPTIGVRGEAFWSRSDIDSPLIRRVGNAVLPPGDADAVSGNVDVIAGVANIVLSTSAPLVQPYVIGGVGLYRRRVEQDISGTIDEFRTLRESENDVGFNAGAGVRLSLGGMAAFLEARYHSINTDPERTTFIPVTIGVAF